jgi:hypothetical protein
MLKGKNSAIKLETRATTPINNISTYNINNSPNPTLNRSLL